MKVKTFRKSINDIIDFADSLQITIQRMNTINNAYAFKIIENAKWKALFLHDDKVVKAIEESEKYDRAFGLYELMKSKTFSEYISKEEHIFLKQFLHTDEESDYYE